MEGGYPTLCKLRRSKGGKANKKLYLTKPDLYMRFPRIFYLLLLGVLLSSSAALAQLPKAYYTTVLDYQPAIDSCHLPQLRKVFGANKTYPLKYELPILIALSKFHFSPIKIAFTEGAYEEAISVVLAKNSSLEPKYNRSYTVRISNRDIAGRLEGLSYNAQIAAIGLALTEVQALSEKNSWAIRLNMPWLESTRKQEERLREQEISLALMHQLWPQLLAWKRENQRLELGLKEEQIKLNKFANTDTNHRFWYNPNFYISNIVDTVTVLGIDIANSSSRHLILSALLNGDSIEIYIPSSITHQEDYHLPEYWQIGQEYRMHLSPVGNNEIHGYIRGGMNLAAIGIGARGFTNSFDGIPENVGFRNSETFWRFHEMMPEGQPDNLICSGLKVFIDSLPFRQAMGLGPTDTLHLIGAGDQLKYACLDGAKSRLLQWHPAKNAANEYFRYHVEFFTLNYESEGMRFTLRNKVGKVVTIEMQRMDYGLPRVLRVWEGGKQLSSQ